LLIGWPIVALAALSLRQAARGKPLFFFSVDGASFQERGASGRAHGLWWTFGGGANNCLVVAIARGRLVVRPFFPFNSFGDMMGLDVDVDVKDLRGVHAERRWFRDWLVIDWVEGSRARSMSLYLRKREPFMAALEAARRS
jgi:hypothetical protein